jgi:hypothetical protein
VYHPSDFIYFGELGSGAFGKVRKCQLKGKSATEDATMDNSSTSSNSDKNPSGLKD